MQGAVAADGVGNLLSGLAGTVPNTTYSSSIAITELTGVAARSVGVWIGVVFVVAAFVPKAAAVLLAVPGPVAAAYITILLSMLFVLGMRMVVRDGADARKAVVVGVSFWVGVGFQNQVIFADQLGGFWGTLLGNGMTTGGLTAMILTAFLNLTGARSRPRTVGPRYHGGAGDLRLLAQIRRRQALAGRCRRPARCGWRGGPAQLDRTP